MQAADPLDRPAKRAAIESLHAAGLLDGAARRTAIDVLRPPLQWWIWISRLLLLLGAALLLSGIVFFFAWNWAAMPRWVKLGSVAAGLLACCGGVVWAGLDALAGRVLVIAAAMLAGVFLAVYGQVYQTGADSYELFLGWAVLIAPWVWLARFAALWVLWLVLADAAPLLWWDQVGAPLPSSSDAPIFVSLAIWNAAFLVLRELGHRRGAAWLAGGWHRWLLLAAVLLWLTLPVVLLIVGEAPADAWSLAALGLWLLAIAGALPAYRFAAADLGALTLVAASVCTVVLAAIGRALAEIIAGEGLLLVLGFAIVGVVGGAVLWLRRLATVLGSASHGI